MYRTGEIIQVKIENTWYEAEIIDITEYSVYVYIFDLGKWRQVELSNIR